MPNAPCVAVEAPTLDCRRLHSFLAGFIHANQGSRDVEHRWLAAYAQDLYVQAFNVKNGNHNTIKKLVEEFRLKEIADKKAELRKQMSVLDSEEANALRAIEKVSSET